MSTETNKALVCRTSEEVWNQGKIAVLDEVLAPNFVFRDPALPEPHSLEDYKRYVTQLRSAFPDLHFTIEDTIAEGDKVVMRWTWHGTNTGDFVTPMMRLPATGKHVTVTGITFLYLAEGKVVEMWINPDTLGLFQQLGLIPMPEPVG